MTTCPLISMTSLYSVHSFIHFDITHSLEEILHRVSVNL